MRARSCYRLRSQQPTVTQTRLRPVTPAMRQVIPAKASSGWSQDHASPNSSPDVCSLFSRFCISDLPALPWSDQPPSLETAVIGKQLAQLNQMGFLTINSQPAVNGCRSDDKIFGWGPSNGYVYQKVRVFIYSSY